MRTLCSALAASLAIAAAAQAEAQQPAGSPAARPPMVQHVTGCYQLTLADSVSWLTSARVSESHRPPAQFSLESVRLPERGSARYAVRPIRLGGRSGLPAAWEPVGADSVSLVWSTGFTGVMLRLQVRGDTLRGIVRPFDDMYDVGEPPDPEAAVLAIRSTCPSGLRVPAA